ncbi:MAG: ribosomal RNA small subunit methyltransferase B [Candidatus Kapaibacterium sp.]|nr:MAG: ribosomal RNA small subunit methyltransferase B [Candidatus Kapabacteria bacterium]
MDPQPLSQIAPPIAEGTPLFEQEGVRSVAVRTLLRIQSTALDAERLVRDELSAHPEWNDFDRALYQELVYGTLRMRAKLDWVLTGFYHGEFPKCMPAVQETLRVALYQILMISKVPPQAAIESAGRLLARIKGETYAAKLVGVLRAIARNVAGIRYPPREQLALHLAVVYSHPMWLVERWLERYGEEVTEQMLAANLERPPLYLAANRVRTDDHSLPAWLEQHSIPFEISPLAPRLVRTNPFLELSALPLAREGHCYVSDPMYVSVAALLEATSPSRLLYVCISPTIALLPLWELATIRSGGISILTEQGVFPGWVAVAQQQLGWAPLEVLTTERDATFDAIALDAPSSGIGLWRRKPEGKWRVDSWDLHRAARRTRELFERAIAYLAPGGIAVVTVASFEPIETTGFVEWIATTHPELERIPADERIVSPSLIQADGTLQSLPHNHRCNSVFVALFQRRH